MMMIIIIIILIIIISIMILIMIMMMIITIIHFHFIATGVLSNESYHPCYDDQSNFKFYAFINNNFKADASAADPWL